MRRRSRHRNGIARGSVDLRIVRLRKGRTPSFVASDRIEHDHHRYGKTRREASDEISAILAG
jgi:hypothetical protein